jgi:hypothetical protein
MEEDMFEPPLAVLLGDLRRPSPEESAGYEAVRDSWVEAPPGLERQRTDPPALPASIREIVLDRSPEDAAFADRMFERLAESDYAGALIAAEALLQRLPRDADALDCAEMSRTELQKVYGGRLGALDQVPSVVMTREAMVALALDVFADFLLSKIDGVLTLHELAFEQGMVPDQALRVLSEFYLQGVIRLA